MLPIRHFSLSFQSLFQPSTRSAPTDFAIIASNTFFWFPRSLLALHSRAISFLLISDPLANSFNVGSIPPKAVAFFRSRCPDFPSELFEPLFRLAVTLQSDSLIQFLIHSPFFKTLTFSLKANFANVSAAAGLDIRQILSILAKSDSSPATFDRLVTRSLLHFHGSSIGVLRLSKLTTFDHFTPITDRPLENLKGNLVRSPNINFFRKLFVISSSLQILPETRLLRDVHIDPEAPLAGLFSTTFVPSQLSSRFHPHIFDIGVSHEIHITSYSFSWPEPGSVVIKFYAARQLQSWTLLDAQTVAVHPLSATTFSLPRTRSMYSRIALIVSKPFTSFDIFGTFVKLPPLPPLPPDPMEKFEQLKAVTASIRERDAELSSNTGLNAIHARLELAGDLRHAEEAIAELNRRIEANNGYDRKFEMRIPVGELEKRRRIREVISGELQGIVTYVDGIKNSSRTAMSSTDILVGMFLLMARGGD